MLTIHQPSSNLFFMFDDVIVLHDKKILMHIATKNILIWLSNNFFEIGRMMNPADFLFTDVIKKCFYQDGHFYRLINGVKHKIDHSDFLIRNDKNKEDLSLPLRESNSEPENEADGSSKDEHETSAGISDSQCYFDVMRIRKKTWYTCWYEFLVLFKRNFKMLNNNAMIFARLCQGFSTSMFIGLIYFNINSKAKDVYEKNSVGILYFLIVNVLYTCSYGGVIAFYKDEDLVFRETMGLKYNLLNYFLTKNLASLLFVLLYPLIAFVVTYFLAKLSYSFFQFLNFLLTGLVLSYVSHMLGQFLGATFKEYSLALIALPTLLTPIVTISGLMVDTNNLIMPFRILQYISPSRYAFNILLKNHFKGEIRDALLNNLVQGFLSSGLSFCFLFLMIVFNIVFGFFMLMFKMYRTAKK